MTQEYQKKFPLNFKESHDFFFRWIYSIVLAISIWCLFEADNSLEFQQILLIGIASVVLGEILHRRMNSKKGNYTITPNKVRFTSGGKNKGIQWERDLTEYLTIDWHQEIKPYPKSGRRAAFLFELTHCNDHHYTVCFDESLIGHINREEAYDCWQSLMKTLELPGAEFNGEYEIGRRIYDEDSRAVSDNQEIENPKVVSNTHVEKREEILVRRSAWLKNFLLFITFSSIYILYTEVSQFGLFAVWFDFSYLIFFGVISQLALWYLALKTFRFCRYKNDIEVKAYLGSFNVGNSNLAIGDIQYTVISGGLITPAGLYIIRNNSKPLTYLSIKWTDAYVVKKLLDTAMGLGKE